MDLLSYRGYLGQVEVDLVDKTLHGYVVGIRDLITFESDSAAQIEHEFRISVDDYLEHCRETGKEPDRPFVGRIVVGTTPERHRLIVQAAVMCGQRVSDWAESILTDAATRIVAYGEPPRGFEAAPPRPKRASARRRNAAAARPGEVEQPAEAAETVEAVATTAD